MDDDEDDYEFGKIFANARSTFKNSLSLNVSGDGPDLFPNKSKLSPVSDAVPTTGSIPCTEESATQVDVKNVIVIDDQPDCPRRTQRSKRTSSRFKQRKKGGRAKKTTERVAIMVSSDSECDGDLDLNKSQDIEEDLNYYQTVLVKWKFITIHRFSIRRLQKLRAIQEQLSEKEKIKPENIMLTLDGKQLNPMESLHSLNISIKDIIDATPVEKALTLIDKTQFYSDETGTAESELKFKIQHKNSRKPIYVTIRENEKLKVLFEKVREELDISSSTLKFRFDGDLLLPNKTASEQDLEGGECIDLEIIPV